jgi:MFS family permease
LPHATTVSVLDAEALARLDAPRDDVVGERPAGAGRYVLDHGPFASYERTLARGEPDAEGRVPVTQHFTWEMPKGTWRPLFTRPMRRALVAGPRHDGKAPWWYPPQRPDAQGALVLGLLASLSLVVGYHGTLLGQTMTFAADEFGNGTTGQGVALSAARIGGLLAIALGVAADRRGRRLLLLVSLLICIASTVAGGFAPNLAVLAGTQAVNRGAWTASSLLLAVVVAEEMPKGSRAYAVSLLSMSTALGAGMALWLLPVAGLGERGWRVLYLAPIVFLPVVLRQGRRMPESRRYARPHRDVTLAGHGRRLALLATAGFLINVFVAPQTQFRNEFLRDERGLSAAAVSLFALATATPAGIGIVVGGRLADTRGRKAVGAAAAVGGTLVILLSFTVTGPAMWVAACLGGILMAPLDPIVKVYGPELFPTSLRARATSILGATAMGGSVVGLLCAGVLRDALGSFGRAMALLALAPLATAVLVVLRFPETAKRELEDLNPEDRSTGPPEDGAAVPADGDGADHEVDPLPTTQRIRNNT